MKIFGRNEADKIPAPWDDKQSTGVQEIAPPEVETRATIAATTPETNRVSPNFAATAGNMAVHGSFNREIPIHDVGESQASAELVDAGQPK